jgi:hypothetical protein
VFDGPQKPMSRNPFSKVELRLKQVDTPRLEPLARYAFDAAFGAYTLDEQQVGDAKDRLSQRLGGAEVQFDRATPRRFAGDATLPRGRYFSVSIDDAGWDGHTLLHEISAYLTGSTYPGLVSFFDTSMANTMELLGILAEIPKKNFKALDLSLPSFLVALRPLDPDGVLHEAFGKGRHYVVQVPFTLRSASLRQVIDLRNAEAQSWLVEQFSGRFRIGERDFPVLLGRRPPNDFAELLPSLLDQWLGGGWATGNLAGFFARRAGADGLVYPSVRSNPSVAMTNGNAHESSGWCFVRYRGAGKMHMTHAFSQASDEWPVTAGYSPSEASWVDKFIPVRNSRVCHLRSGQSSGSWHVEGLAEYNVACYRLNQATTLLKSLGGSVGAACTGRLAYMALFSEAIDISRLANAIVLGALLNTRPTTALESMRAAAASDYERETLSDTIKIVSETPKAFRAGESLARAWGLN